MTKGKSHRSISERTLRAEPGLSLLPARGPQLARGIHPGGHREQDSRLGAQLGMLERRDEAPTTGKDLRTRVKKKKTKKNFRKHRGGWRSLVGKRGEKPGERRRPYFPPKCYLLPLPAKVTSNPGADVKTKATGLIYSYQPGSLLLLKNQSLGFSVPAGKAPVEHVVTQTAGRRKKERTLLSGERRAGLP